jgi:hypothetical protein
VRRVQSRVKGKSAFRDESAEILGAYANVSANLHGWKLDTPAQLTGVLLRDSQPTGNLG